MIDYDELEEQFEKMLPRQRLYEMVKHHMQKRGRWRNFKRGKPFESKRDLRRHRFPDKTTLK